MYQLGDLLEADPRLAARNDRGHRLPRGRSPHHCAEKHSAPAISDLSWLNPAPRAIAVYASQPLSPVATQHSLPSGRYSLLGPDFHRLDRTSFRLAHLLDQLVGTRKQCFRHVEAERLGGVQVYRQLELCWRLYRKLARLRPL